MLKRLKRCLWNQVTKKKNWLRNPLKNCQMQCQTRQISCENHWETVEFSGPLLQFTPTVKMLMSAESKTKHVLAFVSKIRIVGFEMGCHKEGGLLVTGAGGLYKWKLGAGITGGVTREVCKWTLECNLGEGVVTRGGLTRRWSNWGVGSLGRVVKMWGVGGVNMDKKWTGERSESVGRKWE